MIEVDHFENGGNQAFDSQAGYKRDQQEKFAYCHAIKKGGVPVDQDQGRVGVAAATEIIREGLAVPGLGAAATEKGPWNQAIGKKSTSYSTSL